MGTTWSLLIQIHTSDRDRSESDETTTSSAVPELERVIVDLENEESLRGVRYLEDIDSLVACSRSLESFRCRYSAKLASKPSRPVKCKNTKLTKYIENRESFEITRDRAYEHGHRESVVKGTEWFEFSFLAIDDWPVFVLFQPDYDSPFYDDVPTISTSDVEGRLLAACTAFMREVVAAATKTAK